MHCECRLKPVDFTAVNDAGDVLAVIITQSVSEIGCAAGC